MSTIQKMISYESMVLAIRELTGSTVPVYFNVKEANCSGSPYFGIGEHVWDICTEEDLCTGMFDAIDFIEQRHVGYYHVGLPNQILNKNDDYVKTVVSEQLKERNIQLELTKEILECLIILHEFGHADHFFNEYNGVISDYYRDTQREVEYIHYCMRTRGLNGTAEGLRLHKTLPTEKHADNFAFKFILPVLDFLGLK